MASARGLLMHDVWHVLLSWNFRTGALRCRGFEARYGGGGTWLSCCPLCVEIKFQPPSPAKPLTVSGREYGCEAPVILATKRLVVSSRIWLEDATLPSM